MKTTKKKDPYFRSNLRLDDEHESPCVRTLNRLGEYDGGDDVHLLETRFVERGSVGALVYDQGGS